MSLDHGDGDYRVEARGRNGSTGTFPFRMTLAVQTVGIAWDPLAGPDPIPGSPPGQIMPARIAIAMACVRFRAPIRRNVRWTSFLMVLEE